MQHRRVLVERDDVAVGQLLVALADGRAVGEVGLEFGCPGREGVPRRDVPVCGHHRRPPHALEFVGRLDRAVVMQLVQQPRRVGGRESPVGEAGLPLADEGDASSVESEQVARAVRVPQHLETEFTQPRSARQRRRLVPVVGRLVEAQDRLLPGNVADEALLQGGQGHPVLEMRVGPERVRVVVEERESGAARVDRNAVEAVRGERAVHAYPQLREMVRVQRVWIVLHAGDLKLAWRPHLAQAGPLSPFRDSSGAATGATATLELPSRNRPVPAHGQVSGDC